MYPVAQQLLDTFSDVPLPPQYRSISKPSFNMVVAASGPNAYWRTRGEGLEGQNITHVNSVAEVANNDEYPLLKAVIGNESVSETTYKAYASRETASHELGHTILSIEAELIKKRIGVSKFADFLEDLKAELVGLKINADQSLKTGNMEELNAILQAKLGTNLDYFINKSNSEGTSGIRYYSCAAVIIGTLFESEAIIKTEEGYEIANAKTGIEALIQKADSLLKLYADPNTKPRDAQTYAKELITKYADQSWLKTLKQTVNPS